MPRYLVERTFTDGLRFPIDETGRKAATDVIARNAEHGVTWVHSYVGNDDRASSCVYDAPRPNAIRVAAGCNHLPVDRIVQVNVLDPYFYGGES